MKFILLAATAAAALMLAGAAAADQTYPDPAGDAAGGIDIGNVAISNDWSAGTITFTVATSYGGPVDGNVVFTIALDTDHNRNTGLQGFDYLVGLNNQGSRAVSMLNLTWHQETLTSFANGTWSITLPVADIGSPKSFDFVIYADLGPSPVKEDAAPDSGTWAYQLATAPPPPPPATVTGVSPVFAGAPTHGKTFRVTGLAVALSDGTQARATGTTCTATLGGKRIAGGCTLRLPKTSKGKRLVVAVNGTYVGTFVAKTVAFTVR